MDSSDNEIRVTERFEPEAEEHRVTARYPTDESDVRVTQRYPLDPVTQRFPTEAAPMEIDAEVPAPRTAPVTLEAGEMVNDRYRVEEGPLGEPTGEAEVFRCTDSHTADIVALKFYRTSIRPKDSILESLINVQHPDVVTLRDYGTWAGRFYEIMDFCEGGNLMDHMPFDEDALKQIVREVVAGLQYLHSQGIVHRDIKPNNLFFRHSERRDVVIGDFGVSSFLENPDRVRKTSTGGFFTLDYAAPELIDGKEVSPKTDYYGLGITLLHLMTGVSPFAGMDTNAVLGCHFRSKVPRPQGISKEFAGLINGLLRLRPVNRWGYRQVMSWLNHETILTDDGLPDHDEVNVGKQLAYRSCAEITTPAIMAKRLDQFNVARDLKRGRISQWVMYFDTELGKRVAQLEEDYIDRLDLGVFKLRYLLDPTLPLAVGDTKVYSVAQLVRLIAGHKRTYQQDLEALLYSESIETWVHAMQTDVEGAELAAKIGDIRKRISDKSLALFALLYTLDPQRPLALSPHVKIRKLSELEQALVEHRDIIQSVTRCLYSGYFEEWLRICFPHQTDDIAFLCSCAETYRERKELGLFALRCHLHPLIGFPFLNTVAETPKELAAIICRNEKTVQLGLALLTEGWIEVWLVHTGRLKNKTAYDAVAHDYTTSAPRKLEAVLHILDPSLPWPVPAADVDFIDAGPVSTEGTRTLAINVFNAGRGYLAGSVTLDTLTAPDGATGITVDECSIEGQPVQIDIRINARGMSIGSRHNAVVVVDTNGGRLGIPIQYRVAAPIGGILLRTLIAGLVAGQALGLIRFAIQAITPQHASTVMQWFSYDTVQQQAGLWGFIPAGIACLTFIVAFFYYLYSMYQVHR